MPTSNENTPKREKRSREITPPSSGRESVNRILSQLEEHPLSMMSRAQLRANLRQLAQRIRAQINPTNDATTESNELTMVHPSVAAVIEASPPEQTRPAFANQRIERLRYYTENNTRTMFHQATSNASSPMTIGSEIESTTPVPNAVPIEFPEESYQTPLRSMTPVN